MRIRDCLSMERSGRDIQVANPTGLLPLNWSRRGESQGCSMNWKAIPELSVLPRERSGSSEKSSSWKTSPGKFGF